MTALGRVVRMEPPLTPDAAEAREWAERELEKSIYDNTPTLWQRFTDWLSELWERIFDSNTALGPVLMPLVVLLIVAVIIGVALLIGGPIRRRRLRERQGSTEVLAGDERTSKALRAAADAAAADGDYALAVLERYRAIVRSLDERAVLEDRRGRTALEAALAAGARLAPCAADLRRAADMFDGVAYGDVVPGSDDDAWLRRVDDQVAHTKPSRTGELADSELVAPR